MPRFNAPRCDAPRCDAPRCDAPRCDAPRCDAPRLDDARLDGTRWDDTRAARRGFNIHDPRDLLGALPRGQRVIGLDPGSRRIGVALSDVGRRLASPYATLLRGRLAATAAELLAIANAEGAAGLIIGYPLDDEGHMGPAAQAARDWARALAKSTLLPAALWDETLTTADTNQALIAADVSRARRAALVDRLAAARMLQSALDSCNGPAPAP